MLICGIKLTHDASVAVIKNGELLFSHEIEKIGNNKRYSDVKDLSQIEAILRSEGLEPDDIDRFVLDGWHGPGSRWEELPVLHASAGNATAALEVAGYNEKSASDDILRRHMYDKGLVLGGKDRPYASYMHVAGHVMGAYCCSPFASANEAAHVLVWDGGQYPRLYHVDPESGKVENLGQIFFFLGTIYAIMGHYFGPYKRTNEQLERERTEATMEGYFGGYSIAGKLMAYIGLGTVREELLAELPKIHARELEISNHFEHRFAQAVRDHVQGRDYSDADILLTNHVYIEQLLVEGLRAKLATDTRPTAGLCFTGGAALNIKWNSAIRASKVFPDVWVPPFPNDSGSGIGTACCEMFREEDRPALDWNVYLGPNISSLVTDDSWHGRDCSIRELAAVLASEKKPVVFLSGRAELGPRALGNRSILAPATDADMKTYLNAIKRREPFRPVAPICLEEFAPAVFDPGTPDPYMLFDHDVRVEWKERVPAICHVDGTARLQTVSRQDNPDIHELLVAYHEITGIPLLCNTSANLNGSGFFPDVESAMAWDGVAYIHCNGVLYAPREQLMPA